jgi:hypothetical protein
MTNTRLGALAAAFFLSGAFAACSTKSSLSTPSGSFVTVTASRPTVLANGVNTVTIHVQDSAGGSIAVTTNKGTFPGGVISATVQSAGDLVLTTCNTATSATCAGTAVVSATAGGIGGQVSITFGGLELCTADCTVDPTCASHACTRTGGSGTCSATTPSVCTAPVCAPSPAGTTTEAALCSDGIDNDCNNSIDCADTACVGQPCKAGSPTFLCNAGACTDVSSGSAITVTPARTRLPADGAATTAIVVKVTSQGTAQPGTGVTLSTTLGSLSATTATTGADGTATVTFTASATTGAATITASITAIPLVSQSVVVTMPVLGAITLPAGGIQFPVMGVNGSGYREINGIVVALADDQGLAYPAGLAVRFEHQQLGGSQLSAPPTPDTPTCFAASGCVGFLGATDAGGLARVNLSSGRVAGTLSVVVTATAGGISRTFTVPNVAVIGAKANGANFSIVCTPRNVPALAETDCATSLVDATFTCQALLKDRFNNVLGTQTQVTFVTEAAAVGQVTSTPAYDPTQSQPDLGVAKQTFHTLGAGLPFDVSPATGEPFFDIGAPDACNHQVFNPRDGVVTVIAIADGEEAFFDANGNGRYDAGEPFIDLGEPYVDQNDNGQWDQGEWFLDVNQNGVYDGPNGVWDANAKIWTETVEVYTGAPARIPMGGGTFLGSRWIPAASFTTCAGPLAPASFAIVQPPAAPTSQDFVVLASDANLNQLATATTYEVKVVAPATVKATYAGLPSYADNLGFFFSFVPCDQGGNCASQCRATGANAPCLMKPAITLYSCGTAAGVNVSAGSSPDPGLDEVDWKVATTYPVLGGSKTALFVNPIFGTSQ